MRFVPHDLVVLLALTAAIIGLVSALEKKEPSVETISSETNAPSDRDGNPKATNSEKESSPESSEEGEEAGESEASSEEGALFFSKTKTEVKHSSNNNGGGGHSQGGQQHTTVVKKTVRRTLFGDSVSDSSSESGSGSQEITKQTKTIIKGGGGGGGHDGRAMSKTISSTSSGGPGHGGDKSGSVSSTKTTIKREQFGGAPRPVSITEDSSEEDSKFRISKFFDSKHGRIILNAEKDRLPACVDYLPKDACKALKPLCQVSDTARAIRYLRERSDYILYLSKDLQKHMTYVKNSVADPKQEHSVKLLNNLEEIRQLLPSVKKTAPLIRLILDEDSEDELEKIVNAHLSYKQECAAHKQMCYKTHVPAYKRQKACALYDDICCCDNYKFHRYYQSIVAKEKRIECKEAKAMRKATRRLVEASCAATCQTCPTRFRVKEYAENVRRAFNCDHLKIPKGHDLNIHFEYPADDELPAHHVTIEQDTSPEYQEPDDHLPQYVNPDLPVAVDPRPLRPPHPKCPKRHPHDSEEHSTYREHISSQESDESSVEYLPASHHVSHHVSVHHIRPRPQYIAHQELEADVSAEEYLPQHIPLAHIHHARPAILQHLPVEERLDSLEYPLPAPVHSLHPIQQVPSSSEEAEEDQLEESRQRVREQRSYFYRG